MTKSKRRKAAGSSDQIAFNDIKLRVGDKLYKDGIIYAEVADESDTLFFLLKPDSDNQMPSPYIKDKLIENILIGTFTLEKINYE